MHVDSKWLGLTPYSKALDQQAQAWQQVHNKELSGVILGCEHPAVITLGRSAQRDSELKLQATDFEVYQIDRGGQATLHNPGQLVIYPIISLNDYNLRIKDFIFLLEQVSINTLSELGVESFRKENSPGLYTENGKIVFIGIRIDQKITRHGISINVKNNLWDFDKIRICGHDSQ